MKKFLAMLLAALLVVSMFTFAMAEGTTEGGTTEGGTTEGGTTEGGTTEGGTTEGGTTEGGDTTTEATPDAVVVTPAPTNTPAPDEDEKETWIIELPDGSTIEVPVGSEIVWVTATPEVTEKPTQTPVPTITPVPDPTYYPDPNWDADYTVDYDNNGVALPCTHKFEAVTVYGDASTTDGNVCGQATVVYRCSKCGKIADPAIDGSKYAPFMDGTIGHQFDMSQVKVISEGDCTHESVKEIYCTRCKKWITVKALAGHKYEWTTVKKATCVSTGEKKGVCTICGYLTEEAIPKVSGGHKFDLTASSTFVAQRATCTENGTYSAVCTICGGIFEYDPNAGVPVEKIPSSFGSDTALSASNPRGVDALIIKKRGHNLAQTKEIQSVTCMRDGIYEMKCQNRQQTATHEACFYEQTKVVDHTEKVWDARVQEVVCKYHNLVEVVEKEATASTYGIHYYKCTTPGCGYVSKQVSYLKGVGTDYNGQYSGAKANPGASSATSTTTKPSSGSKPASSSTNKKGVSIPKTNDSTSNLPYVLIAAAFIGLVALVASKKKVHG